MANFSYIRSAFAAICSSVSGIELIAVIQTIKSSNVIDSLSSEFTNSITLAVNDAV